MYFADFLGKIDRKLQVLVCSRLCFELFQTKDIALPVENIVVQKNNIQLS